VALTELSIRNAKAMGKPTRLSDERGLYLEISTKGGKWWRLRYSFKNKPCLISLGTYPDVSLKEARQRRDIARRMIANGVNPSEARKEQKAESVAQIIEQSTTFESVARDWHEKQIKVWSAGHADRIIGRMENHLFPIIGSTPLTHLRAPDILPLLREIEAKGNHETTKRLRQYCESIFAFAIVTGQAERNVGLDLRGALAPSRTKNRPAITEPKAVGALLRAIDSYEGSPVTRNALRLAPLVFVRPGELRMAEWFEIDMDAAQGPQWVIPAEKTKMRRPHIVPLARQAVAILEEMRLLTGGGRFVFPCNRSNDRCMSDMTMNAALRRLGYDQGTMCAHGFRAMASTLLHELGWSSEIIERQLAHAEGNKVKAAYNRAEHLPEHRKLMSSWANYLDSLRAGGKVIPLHSKAANE